MGRCCVAFVIFLASCTSSSDEPSISSPIVLPPDLPSPPELKEIHQTYWKEVFEPYEKIEKRLHQAQDLITTYNKCVERGGTNCALKALLCSAQQAGFDMYNKAHGGVFANGVLGDPLKAFKLRCGGVGEDCYACCHIPGADGCWSAIPSDGKKSIDCDNTYGPDAQIIGDTLVFGPDDNGGPQACLGAQVTCDHLAACTGGAAPASGTDAFGVAVDDVRARAFGARASGGTNPQLAKAVFDHMNRYPASRRKAPLFDFITGRGFAPLAGSGVASWMDAVDNNLPFSDTFAATDPFAVVCGPYQQDGACQPPATVDEPSSYLQAIMLFVHARAIESIPNGYNRFVAAESRIWTHPDVDAALAAAGIADADAELRKTTSGFLLDVLKDAGLQDYRLLAIPLPHEAPAPSMPAMYGGYALGTPPFTTLAPAVTGSKLALAVTMHDAMYVAGTSRSRNPIAIDWGDGHTDNYGYDMTQATMTFTHSYATAGNKIVYVTTMNGSGLRGVTAEVVTIASADAMVVVQTTPYAVKVEDVRFYAHSPHWTGRAVVYLDGVDDNGHVIPLGESEDLQLENLGTGPNCGGGIGVCSNNGPVSCSNGATPSCALGQSLACHGDTATCMGVVAQSFGTIVGYNPTGAKLTAIRLRPIVYGGNFTGEDPTWMGSGINFTVGAVTLESRGPAGIGASGSFAVTPANVKLFWTDSNKMEQPATPVTGFDGRVRLSLVLYDPTAWNGTEQPMLTRIEIPLGDHAAPSIVDKLDELARSPQYTAGMTTYWIEDRPGRLVAAGLQNGVLVASTSPSEVTDYDHAELDPALVSVRVVPPPNGVGIGPATGVGINGVAPTQQFVAIGTYSDGSTADLTHAATWTSTGPTIAAHDVASGTRTPPATTVYAAPAPPCFPPGWRDPITGAVPTNTCAPDRYAVTVAPGGLATLTAAPSSPVTVTATVGGMTASVTGLFVTGKISPAGTTAAGSWSAPGPFALVASETLHVDCDASGNDQITVTGAADLGNAQLEIADSCRRTASDTLTIATATTLAGQFHGLAEGAIVRGFRVHYTATNVQLIREHADLIGFAPVSSQWWIGTSNGSAFTNKIFAAWSTQVPWTGQRSGDFDGDGKTDVIGRVVGGSWWLTTATDTRPFATWSNAVTYTDDRVGDFDGDGKADVVARDQNGNWWLAVSRPGATPVPSSTTLFATWSAVPWAHVVVGDFNGDGKTDLAGFWPSNGVWVVATSTGTTATTAPFAQWADNTHATWVDIRVGDFDGDGKADIAGRWLEGGQWWVSYGGTSPMVTTQFATWSTAVAWTNIVVADFDGDGKTDIAGQENGAWWVSYANGRTQLASSYDVANWSSSPTVTWVQALGGDVTGDGTPDIVARYAETGQWWVAAGSRTRGAPFTTSYFGFWPVTSWLTGLGEVDGR